MISSQSFTRKTLIESDEQVLAFTSFIKAQHDLIEEKKKSFECLEEEGESAQSNLELVIGVDCEGMSRHKNLAMIQVSRPL
jgi:hypothetical protein